MSTVCTSQFPHWTATDTHSTDMDMDLQHSLSDTDIDIDPDYITQASMHNMADPLPCSQSPGF